jgi:hypothetical protein
MSSSQVAQRTMIQLENMLQKSIGTKAQELMDSLKSNSYNYSHMPDEVTRNWLLMLLDICETMERTKEQFGLPSCVRDSVEGGVTRDYSIQRDDSYVNQVSYNCDAICQQIKMISERVKELNCKNRKKWWNFLEATLQEVEETDMDYETQSNNSEN